MNRVLAVVDVPGRRQGGSRCLGGCHQRLHLAARRIVADHADQHRAAAKGGNIERHVRRTAQRAAIAGGPQHGIGASGDRRCALPVT